MGSTLKIASWNINSIRLRLPMVLDFIAQYGPDVIMFQEIKCLDDQFPRHAFRDAGYPHMAVHGQKGYHGVAIVSKFPLTDVSSRMFCEIPESRHISALTDFGHGPVTLHDFYIPAGGDEPDPEINPKFKHKLGFLSELTSWFTEPMFQRGHLIAGDFNIAPHENDVWSHRQLLKIVSHTPVETEALNALLIQSAGPLFVALWSLILFGVRLTGAQLAGITISLAGVLVIILRGDFSALAGISFNRGDLMFASSLVSFGLYSALMPRRPVTHALSLISFTTCCGALMLLPFSVWEFSTGATLKFDPLSMATLAYVVIFPSTLAYMFFNRGLALIGPNRAAPFFHLVPVFGSAMAILLLGEQLRLFHLAGYALVLAGVAIASRRGSAKS